MIDLYRKQEIERADCLHAIIKSSAKKKIIVAGPGTGKTFTFGELLRRRGGDNNIAITFIRKLVDDMEKELGQYAEVTTFHKFCKKHLHRYYGSIRLVPYLPKIIEQDAGLFGKTLKYFESKFRNLESDSDEIKFYLERREYYKAVSFDDSVYLLYSRLKANAASLPNFDLILVDEYQDFNLLEVRFINELEKCGNIVIVGDDDQAVYHGRSASPKFLRKIYFSDEYEEFSLPYCSRCPEAIVKGANGFLEKAIVGGYLKNRIEKPFRCYKADKEKEDRLYPNIKRVRCTKGIVLAKYIMREINSIRQEDITESYDNGYPTVLIVGKKQFLNVVAKQLKKFDFEFTWEHSKDPEYTIMDAYDLMIKGHDPNNNLAWRILLQLFLNDADQKIIIKKSIQGIPLEQLLPDNFIENHVIALHAIGRIVNNDEKRGHYKRLLKSIVGDYLEEILYTLEIQTVESAESEEPDKTKPTILLKSFEGCKGLSGGHVFIVGAHNGVIPANVKKVREYEIAQFFVALTRTRKQCHILSCKWLANPKDHNGNWKQESEDSLFLSWLPKEYIDETDLVKANDLK